MEPRNTMNLTGGRLFVEIGGERKELCGVLKVEITAPKEECDGPVRLIAPKEAEYKFTLFKREAPGMNRKRFIKLLMSMGFQRNKAHKMAADAHSKGHPYRDALFMLKMWGY